MNVSFNVLHVLGLAYCFGVAHHFWKLLKHCAEGIKRDRYQIQNPMIAFMVASVLVMFMSLLWPITALVSIYVFNRNGG